MTVASSNKKFVAAGGVAIGLVSFGMFASAGTATADGTLPDTGSYDETFGIDKPATQQTLAGSYGPHGADMGTYDALLSILDPDGFQAAKP
jgi:hypothetical protein